MNLWYDVWKGDTFLQTNFDQQSLVILPFCTGSQWNLVSEKLTALPGYQISLTSCTKWENDGESLLVNVWSWKKVSPFKD